MNYCDYFSEVFETVFEDYAAERFKTAHAKSQYLSALRGTAMHFEKSIEFLSSEDWKAYFAFLCADGQYNKDTIYHKRRVFRALLSYMDEHAEKYRLPGNLSARLSGLDKIEPNIDVKGQNVAELKDALKLIHYLRETRFDDTVLLAALLSLQYCMSLRDMISLTRDNLATSPQSGLCIQFTDETEEDRNIAVSKEVADLIEQLARRSLHTGYKEIFMSRRGKPLSQRALQHRMSEAVLTAGLSDLTLNKLRNLSIIYLLENGVSEEEITVLTGTSKTWLFRYKPHIGKVVMAGKNNTIIEE